jgi:hypothetical protein
VQGLPVPEPVLGVALNRDALEADRDDREGDGVVEDAI